MACVENMSPVRWADGNSTRRQILEEAPELLRSNAVLSKWWDVYEEALMSEDPVESSEGAREVLWGEDGLLVVNGLKMVVAAQDKLRMYERPEVPYLFTPEGEDYWGGWMMAIDGPLRSRKDGQDGANFLSTPGGTLLKIKHLGREILDGLAIIVPAREELASNLNDEPLRESPVSTMDGLCGSCTQFDCRHGRFAWMNARR